VIQVRRATAEDAEAAVEVMRRSITELCAEDWRHDPAVLARWLANKTVGNWRLWAAREDALHCVAVDGERIAGIGMVGWDGEIRLNYVAPESCRRGASTALMDHMEAALAARGVAEARLLSTHLAHPFYRRRGYVEIGHVESDYGTLDAIEMTKRLPSRA
jgi:GNAT superfamily N-acetyltransferase